jgi:hypothetical protein
MAYLHRRCRSIAAAGAIPGADAHAFAPLGAGADCLSCAFHLRRWRPDSTLLAQRARNAHRSNPGWRRSVKIDRGSSIKVWRSMLTINMEKTREQRKR